MKSKNIEEYLAKFKGSEGSYPFGPEALVFKVMGKMFALASQEEKIQRVTLKIKPAAGEVLISQFDSVSPGYYMNKKHWITVSLKGDLPEGMIYDIADGSYELVVNKLTKADRKKLEEQK